MAENSKIEWTDHTFNPWRGCTKVSPGCAHCYAETLSHRNPAVLGEWGPGRPRIKAAAAMWRQPLKWNREAGEAAHWIHQRNRLRLDGGSEIHHRPRVFCASLADWLDDEVPIEWLADLLALIHSTPNLDWLMLTKRPENLRPRLSAAYSSPGMGSGKPETDWIWHWANGHGCVPSNVWIGTSVEDQQRADERIPLLLKIPARVRFLSCEPLLGPVDLTAMPLNPADPLFRYWPLTGEHIRDGMNEPVRYDNAQTIHWLIAGGESGHSARPMHPAWARSLRDQCAAAGVPFLFKQWGESTPAGRPYPLSENHPMPDAFIFHPPGQTHVRMERVGKRKAGRLLDGREWNEFPKPTL